ncbi:MAG: hypothetical protein DWH78_12335 [Planctomycetota bacterium]|nr:MAG: hypothetical protein DWH78_12335 [Planctomycetota bacterium]
MNRSKSLCSERRCCSLQACEPQRGIILPFCTQDFAVALAHSAMSQLDCYSEAIREECRLL